MLVGLKQLGCILYLSCNPESLARDLQVFARNGWDVQRVIPFDFFPKTKHLETLVLLSPQK
jgi:tRNA/tmRNA/rRNA uracil-C5-methylase (TrmA/RlmC/RlmD family)